MGRFGSQTPDIEKLKEKDVNEVPIRITTEPDICYHSC